ncbi:putative RNA dependent RNA polymerase [Podospora australis]|uniref:RNA-dependent RNA polymerase n=1 Tax=Podospora australis TaxID=1536484 RepID=A0AAN6WV76_9PEZI|nr:putative RNA dependent RNA polymerase [Podospora australis]
MPPFSLNSPYPTTPKNDVVDLHLQIINSDYGLEIENVKKLQLTAEEREQLKRTDQDFARRYQICGLIHYLSFQRPQDGSEAYLQRALTTFLYEAKAASRNWIPKPKADPTTLPTTQNAPRAITWGHRIQLEELLARVLEDVKQHVLEQIRTPSMRSLAKSNSEFGSVSSTPSSESLGSKRKSDDEETPTNTKRTKPQIPSSVPSLKHTTSAPPLIGNRLDHVPSRQRPGPERPKQSAMREAPPRGSYGAASPRPPPSQFTSSSKTTSHAAAPVPIRRSQEAPALSSNYPARSRSPHKPTPNGIDDFDENDYLADIRDAELVELTEAEFEFGRQNMRKARPLVASTPKPAVVDPQRPVATAAPKRLEIVHQRQQELAELSEAEFKYARHDMRKARPVGGATPKPVAAVPLAQQLMTTAVHEPPAMVAQQNGDVFKPTASPRKPNSSPPKSLGERLQNIWPKFPYWLRPAPLAIAWEVTRICLHSGADIDHPSLQYDPAWATYDPDEFRKSLARLEAFRGKYFPAEKPAAEVWKAALSPSWESKNNTVVLSISLEFNPDPSGPLFEVNMRPLRFDKSCRLTRHFGGDRFFEVLFPSPTAQGAPPVFKDGGADQVIDWLTATPHPLVGRQWRAFFAKDAGFRKPPKDYHLGTEQKPVFKERIHFFAESGENIRRLPVSKMLDWLLGLSKPKNQKQPHLKLFSRIQLGLSKTYPAVVLQPHQIRIEPADILSPIGRCMNDGIGLMSPSVARKVRDALGLTEIPSAIQARIGPAKGMWLMDVKDTSQEDWISTYPSQRKWDCDADCDVDHRTLEVRSVATELKSAGLNMQFLPVLEDRAKDKEAMRIAIANRLMDDLNKEFEGQKAALQHPLRLRQWVHENWSARPERLKTGSVQFLAGLPDKKEESLTYLLNNGFDPCKQKYLQDIAFELQRQKTDTLINKLNIRIGCSAYVYMCVDFWGVLEEGEVHIGFSNKFRDEGDDKSYTLLADCDVLVARSPAHFPSDIQKVRAVFRPELHALKDVIVFSAKGDVPLADMLSGGDYDGDMAWVCWDIPLCTGFVNSKVPKEPDLSRYLSQDEDSFRDLIGDHGGDRDAAVYDMIGKSFKFAMQPNYLGICTNYKERLCYVNNSVSDEGAIVLSTLVGKLVDQSKQGIIFNKECWARLQRDYGMKPQLPDPAYKGDRWMEKMAPSHIIDYLKFSVAAPAVDKELDALHRLLNNKDKSRSDNAAHYYDRDLVVYHDLFAELSKESKTFEKILTSLREEIEVLKNNWSMAMSKNSSSPLTFPQKVALLYDQYCKIGPTDGTASAPVKLDSRTALLFMQPMASGDQTGGAYSWWELLKASSAFKYCYQRAPKMVFLMAGRQLVYIKAWQVSSAGSGQGPFMTMTPLMYAALNPDGRFVKQHIAAEEYDGTEYPDDPEVSGIEDDIL